MKEYRNRFYVGKWVCDVVTGLTAYTMNCKRRQIYCIYLCRYSSYGLAHRSSIPSRGKIVLVSITSRLALRPTQPPIQLVLGAGVKLTTHLHQVPRSRTVELYLQFPIRHHGVVLNYLSTRTTLPLPAIRIILTRASREMDPNIL
jgi:hypothetical protein